MSTKKIESTTEKIRPLATAAERREIRNKLLEVGLWDEFLKLCRFYKKWWNKKYPEQEISSDVIEKHSLNILVVEIELQRLVRDKASLASALKKARSISPVHFLSKSEV